MILASSEAREAAEQSTVHRAGVRTISSPKCPQS